MKQILQSTKTGSMIIVDVPAPLPQTGMVVVRNRASLVSAGTERTLVDFAKKGLLQKARARPDLVRQVFDKINQDGLLTTFEAVRTRLDNPMALGYSCAGVVQAVGSEVTDFRVGQPVACAGFGYAVHAEIVAVPKNLVVAIPNNVCFEDAAFTTLGAIALQGIRQANPQLGENVAVIGLGLLGQLTVQMLKANGCRVFGVDLDSQRITVAQEAGVDLAVMRSEAIAAAEMFTGNRGFDAVLITADTTSNDPLTLAGELARDRGVVVVIGAVGMAVPRKTYYTKELELRLSRSYGPGRYDPQYEEQGIDYPYGYIRWTENRNMQAFLHLVASGQVNVQRLITHRFPIDQAEQAYDVITGKAAEPFLGVVLTYSDSVKPTDRLALHPVSPSPVVGSAIRVGMIGAGAFANTVLLPALRQTEGVQLRGVCTSTGVSSTHSGRRFGFEYACTNETHVLEDAEIDLVVIATPHHLHASQVIAALEHGKHVFCEKPLCLNQDELEAIVEAHRAAGRHLMVGFNRRFAPLALKLKTFVTPVREPLLLHYRVNGGYIPPDHWIQDPMQGGGRLIGEVCHFIDFLGFLTSQTPSAVFARALPNSGRYTDDNLVLILSYPNGSTGTITYAANGDKALGKERVEVFGGGRTAVLEDFRHLKLIHNGKQQQHRLRLRQDKGHRGEWQALVAHLTGQGPAPILFSEILATTSATLAAKRSLATGNVVDLTSEEI